MELCLFLPQVSIVSSSFCLGKWLMVWVLSEAEKVRYGSPVRRINHDELLQHVGVGDES